MTELMWSLTDNYDTEDLNCGDTGYVGQGRRRVNGTTTPCLGEDNFYAFSAIEMKVIVVGPGLDTPLANCRHGRVCTDGQAYQTRWSAGWSRKLC